MFIIFLFSIFPLMLAALGIIFVWLVLVEKFLV
jgi:hypothetical protein